MNTLNIFYVYVLIMGMQMSNALFVIKLNKNCNIIVLDIRFDI